MIHLQDPNIQQSNQPIEIDAVIQDLQAQLDTNLPYMTHAYGRCYRNIQRKDGKLMYMPEVYEGKKEGKYKYHSVDPDNDKKGTCFFLVDKENNKFEDNADNYLSYPLSIIFWVNLKKIDDTLLETEDFTQHLVRDARKVLTRASKWYQLKIVSVNFMFNEIFKEFNLDESKNYLRAPYSGFRFNCTVKLPEDCDDNIDRGNAIAQNISVQETLEHLLPALDFSKPEVFNALSEAQKTQLLNQL